MGFAHGTGHAVDFQYGSVHDRHPFQKLVLTNPSISQQAKKEKKDFTKP
jgi:hypothetical protein